MGDERDEREKEMSVTVQFEVEPENMELFYNGVKLNDASKIIELVKENDRLKTDNERLKKALQAFIKWDEDYPPGGNPMSGFYEFNSLISDAQFLLWELERTGTDTNVPASATDTNVGTKGGE